MTIAAPTKQLQRTGKGEKEHHSTYPISDPEPTTAAAAATTVEANTKKAGHTTILTLTGDGRNEQWFGGWR